MHTANTSPTQNSKAKRQKEIVSQLTANPKLSQEDLAEILSTGLRTIKDDFKELKSRGYQISSRRGIFIPPSDMDILPFQPNKNDVYAVIILIFLSAYSHNEFHSDDLSNLDPSISEVIVNCGKEIGFSRSSAYNHINYLEKIGLAKNPNKHWSPTSIFCTSLIDIGYLLIGSPDSLQSPKGILDEDDLLEFSAYCLSLGNEYGDKLYLRIINYLAVRQEFRLARKDDALCALPDYLAKLKKMDYKHMPLSFKYAGKDKPFFYVCKVIYSHEKNQVYLLGKSRPTKASICSYETLIASKIDWETMKHANTKMLNEPTTNSSVKTCMNNMVELLSYTMMDVTCEMPRFYEIKIKYSIKNYHELKRLLLYRIERHTHFKSQTSSKRDQNPLLEKIQNAPPDILVFEKNSHKSQHFNTKIDNSNWFEEEKYDYFIYRDYLSGQSDIANYVRRFGDEVSICPSDEITLSNIIADKTISIGNDKLRKELKNGAERALKKYSEFTKDILEQINE